MPNIDKIRLSGVTYDIIDSTSVHSLDGYWTSEQTNAAIVAMTDAIVDSLNEKADLSAFTAHTADTTIHVTVADKNAWNAKLDASDVAGLFGFTEYDSTSKHINFYHDSTKSSVLGYIDATDFIKDGMVSNVEVKNATVEGETVLCLVITFNTDAGHADINIPITQIFDASNYYTKAQVDKEIEDNLKNYYQDMVQPALNQKQATLVSGTNIKTINNESILGSGNITIEAAGTVDTAMSDSSTNAVQNKVIKTYVDNGLQAKNQVIALDGTTLVIS